MKFFGMGNKSNYLICHLYRGTFSTLDKKSKMTMWSTATGKVLCSKKRSEDEDGLKDYEVY